MVSTATRSSEWFSVDKAGLGKLLARKGKGFVIAELLQNAWDEDVTEVRAMLAPGKEGTYVLVVEDDDPEGFTDISHAFTLFAESEKKADATRRGRFNLGEKLVLALCDTATIATTTGTVRFTASGRRFDEASKTTRGSTFTGVIPMTPAEATEAAAYVRTLIPPKGVTTLFNGVPLDNPTPVRTFEAILATEVADKNGEMQNSRRKATIRLFEPEADAPARILEMGIPVVGTGDRWHADIGQKIPLSFQRDSVRPAFLRDLRVATLNAAYDLLSPEDATAGWVKDALGTQGVSPEAVEAVMTLRFGVKRVAFDPSDPEANKIAMANGYTVIPGRGLSKDEWANVKAAGAVQPAGKVTPSPKAIEGNISGNRDAVLGEDKIRPGMQAIADYTMAVAPALIGRAVNVRFVVLPNEGYVASYLPGAGQVTFNVGRLGYAWFEQGATEDVNATVIHELAHERCSDHLDARYADECSRLGHRLAKLYREHPATPQIAVAEREALPV